MFYCFYCCCCCRRCCLVASKGHHIFPPFWKRKKMALVALVTRLLWWLVLLWCPGYHGYLVFLSSRSGCQVGGFFARLTSQLSRCFRLDSWAVWPGGLPRLPGGLPVAAGSAACPTWVASELVSGSTSTMPFCGWVSWGELTGGASSRASGNCNPGVVVVVVVLWRLRDTTIDNTEAKLFKSI